MINSGVKSGGSYQGINWAVRKGVAAKRGTITESAAVNLILKDKEGSFETTIDKTNFGQVAASVRSASEFLNELFQNS